jgi:predicted AlkP superfamily phosphohydrolase/phosphomutase
VEIACTDSRRETARMQRKAEKAIVIGIDGVMPEMVRKFAQEGTIPYIAGLMRDGIFSEMLPSPPCDTPTNWTSLGTGAYTGTHGNNTFAVHYAGEPFGDPFEYARDNRLDIAVSFLTSIKRPPNGFHLNEICQAEYLWEALAKADKKAILVNWPGGWPPTINEVVAVDASGPYSSNLCRLNDPNYFCTPDAAPDANVISIPLVQAEGWHNLPSSHSPLLESAILVSGEGTVEKRNGEWVIGEVAAADKGSRFGGAQWLRPWLPGGEADAAEAKVLLPLIYYLLVVDSQGDGYDRVLVAKEKDAAKALVVLQPGGWSPWLSEKLDFVGTVPKMGWAVGEPYSVEVENSVCFRLRLSELSADGNKLGLYRTTLFNREGWAHPEEITQKLLDHLFESRERDEIGHDGTMGTRRGAAPLGVLNEFASIKDYAHGLATTATFLAEKYPWDLLMVQIHAPDGINHELLNAVCPGTASYDADKEEEAWDEFRSVYRVLDGMVGDIVRTCGDDRTLVAIVSDHGCLPTNKVVWLGEAMIEAGLTTYVKDEDTGMMVVDWTKTKAILGNYPYAQNVWVNLRGRDPDGIVEPGEEYESVCSEILNALRAVRDPETGESPVALAIRKEDAGFLGQWGDRTGDIIYFLAPGYGDAMARCAMGLLSSEALSQGAFQSPDQQGMPGRSPRLIGRHECYLPSARYAGVSVRAVLIAKGPGVKQGYVRPRACWTPDLVPTIASLAGFPLPAQSEGSVLSDILA